MLRSRYQLVFLAPFLPPSPCASLAPFLLLACALPPPLLFHLYSLPFCLPSLALLLTGPQVAAIAREGDLQRGRLQEAGAIQVLEQLWMGMVRGSDRCAAPSPSAPLTVCSQMHNIDGDVAVLMRDEALKALQAVRLAFAPPLLPR